ncbi:polysaccharide deacetylase family protein [Kitasatospora sp. NBC_01539]|uniref:polysaccharide deacetylase family protein n=1 Tax=Kitasatospora sp. NBC_01539 TaxID=2903577 RepID=UPI0038600D57
MQIGSSGSHRVAPALWVGLALALTACSASPPPAPPTHPTTSSAAPLPPAAVELPGRAGQQEVNAATAALARDLADRRAQAKARSWGLERLPRTAPPPPGQRPAVAAGQSGVILRPGLPPVVQRVPTDDRVIFLTIDDGAAKDPEFARMTAELGIPYSTFLTGYLARSDYGYFLGLGGNARVAVNNHTLDHRDMRRLTPADQRAQICGQQDELARATGIRPQLFRPPYGEYTDDTLRAAQECGIRAVPLWNEEAFPDRIEYRYADHRLYPGDIVLTHFRGPGEWSGTMADMLRRVLRTADEQGFTLALLDDYL